MTEHESDPLELVEFELKLKVGAENLTARGRISSAPLRVADFLPVVHSISNAVGASVARRQDKAGKPISCRAGCAACCRQPVPIGEAEAIQLMELVDEMPEEQQARVRRRFTEAHRILEENDLLDELREIVQEKNPQARQEFALRYFKLQIPCPFLEDENCTIHPVRPLACREYSVTSPPAQCSDPNPDQIKMVKLPYKLSYLVYRLGDGVGEDAPRWTPLILALESAEQYREDPPPSYPGKLLFENFIRLLKGVS